MSPQKRRICHLSVMSILIVCGIISPSHGQNASSEETELLLQKYDFVSSSLQEYGRRATGEEITQAVKDVQYMAGLAETGDIDNATWARIEGRRCGRADDVASHRNGTHATKGVRWKREITWAIVRYNWRLSGIEDIIESTRVAIKQACNFWEDQVPSLSFREIIGEMPKLVEADIRIKFAKGSHEDSAKFDSEGGVLAHASYPGEISEGDVHFDETEKWSLNLTLPVAAGDVSLYATAVHEIGHFLGLKHSNSPESVMFPWYDENITSLLALTSEERELVNRLTEQGAEDNTTASNDTSLYIDCPDSVDAVLLNKRKIFVFKNNLYWLIDANGYVVESAVSIHKFWYGLPANLTKIDAVYYSNTRVVFFIGRKYFTFSTNERPRGSPERGRPITDFCLPASVTKVDAAFVWGHNQRTYIISGNMYWRYNERVRSCASTNAHYPKDMSVWGGVKLPVDAAFTSFDDNVYFFHKEHFWKFNDYRMSIEAERRRDIGYWLSCKKRPEKIKGTTTPEDDNSNNSAATLSNKNIVISVLTINTVWLLSTFAARTT